MKKIITALLFCTLCLFTLAALADTLVGLDQDGKPIPGLSKKWSREGQDIWVFELDAQLADRVYRTLSAKLGAVVERRGSKIVVIGLNEEQLFSRLAAIEIEESDTPCEPTDPFNDMGGEVLAGLQTPDGSSSIRVAARIDDAERMARQFTARIVSIERKTWPYAKAKIQIISEPTRQHPDAALKKDQIVLATPFFTLKAPSTPLAPASPAAAAPAATLAEVPTTPAAAPCSLPDFADPSSRLNLGLWYMKKGDKVSGLVSGTAKDGVNVLYLERVRGE